MSIELIVVCAVIVFVVVYIIAIYNRLVILKNRFQNAFAQIEVQLKRRYDLIPNLIETAKGYLKHERETLEAVIAARNVAANQLASVAADPSNRKLIEKFAGSERALGNALGQLNIAVEAYPELKANENMMQLSEEMTSTENKVAFARQGFNDAVTDYNVYRQSFPNVVFAGLFGHATDATLLEFEDSEAIQEAPKVQF